MQKSEHMNPLEAYIESVFNFEKNQDPTDYEGRVGPPEALPAVIGRISMNFQSLEDELSNRIIQMLNIDQEIGEIITAELSYNNKVNLFASLYYKMKDIFHFSSISGYEDGYFKELLKALNRCEEFRNQILHSSIIKDWRTKQIVRKKTTAKARKGLSKINQQVDIPYLFNIADYIVGILMELENFFIDFKLKNNT
jgi:hypothetical protein